MKEQLSIANHNIEIPAVLLGNPENRLIIAIHGDLSHKEDTVIQILAKNAILKGYGVLSFDLPEHGGRKNDSYECNPMNCISDLQMVYAYAETLNKDISLFACSIGAYFSLLAYHDLEIQKTMFLSPIVNMERVIQGMMSGFNVNEQRLKEERKIPLPIGKVLDWDYYSYVRQHPADFRWDSPVSILYGSKDMISLREEIDSFSHKYNGRLTVLENGEHYFSSEEQLYFFEKWLDNNL